MKKFLKSFGVGALTIFLMVATFLEIFFYTLFEGLTFRVIVFFALIILSILVFQLLTAEEKRKEELSNFNKKLTEIGRQKDEFISMAAHELRAPLSAIKGYLSMVVEGDTGDIPEKTRGFLADANSINERLIRLVNNMLNVSRIEEGRMVYQWENESLSRVTRAVFAQFRAEAEREGLEYSLEIDSGMKDKIYVDPDRIYEVIGNLISNAVKYTNKGSVLVKLSQPSKTKVRFEVIDTGPGITDEEQGRLFKKFYRAESSVGKTIGTGLGLYISKLLVEKFGGRIGLESEIDKGSKFWFDLPLAESLSKKPKGSSS
jgi:signal transduction histidine kinase